MSRPNETRGRKPKPTALRILNGNPSGRPLNTKEAMPSKDINIDPPEHLQLSDLAKETWTRLAPMAHNLGLLTEADIDAFARYCDMLARWHKLRIFIDEKGETVEICSPVYEGHGREKQLVDYVVTKIQKRPEVALYTEIDRALGKLEAEFGFTPSARTRIHATNEDQDAEDWAKYFGGPSDLRIPS